MHHLQKVALGFVVMGFGFQGIARAADPAAAPAASDVAMMQAAQKFMTPNENHRRLEPTVGNFNAQVTMWMKPGDKPQTSDGTTENVWTLNGRFVQGTYKGTFNGQPFEGIGYTGYDNVREEYQMVWLDGMGTGMMFTSGKFDGKAIHTSGIMGCPMTGDKNMWYRNELKINGPNKHTYSSYAKGPDGKEYKSMQIIYTRVK